MRPLVLLPGLQGHAAEMAQLARALGGVALDLPPGSPREAALALTPILRARFGGPVDVVGASFGALVARSLPAGGQTIAIAALAGPSGVPSRQRWSAAALSRLPALWFARAYRVHLRRDLAREGVSPEVIAALDVPRDADALRGRLRGVLGWDVGPLDARPAGWILGDSDPFGPAIAATWSALAPEVPHLRVTGAHRPHLTRTAQVADWIGAILARSPLGGT